MARVTRNKYINGILIFSAFIVVVLIVACGADNSTNNNVSTAPTITGISPNTTVPGQQNVPASITGSNFTGAVTVTMGDGITVKSATAVSSSMINIVFSASSTISSGPRTITVTASGGTASSDKIFSVAAAQDPIADFSATENKDIIGQFTFDASASTGMGVSIQNFSWDFGDGVKQEGGARNVVHQYAANGNYNVNLKVTTVNGNGTTSKPIHVDFPDNCGYKDVCAGFDHPQNFTIVAVAGQPNAATIVSDRNLYKCNAPGGEIRRINVPPESPDEFLGDIEPGTLTCRTMKLKVYGLPFYRPPKVGEKVYLVYKNG